MLHIADKFDIQPLKTKINSHADTQHVANCKLHRSLWVLNGNSAATKTMWENVPVIGSSNIEARCRTAAVRLIKKIMAKRVDLRLSQFKAFLSRPLQR